MDLHRLEIMGGHFAVRALELGMAAFLLAGAIGEANLAAAPDRFRSSGLLCKSVVVWGCTR